MDSECAQRSRRASVFDPPSILVYVSGQVPRLTIQVGRVTANDIPVSRSPAVFRKEPISIAAEALHFRTLGHVQGANQTPGEFYLKYAPRVCLRYAVMVTPAGMALSVRDPDQALRINIVASAIALLYFGFSLYRKVRAVANEFVVLIVTNGYTILFELIATATNLLSIFTKLKAHPSCARWVTAYGRKFLPRSAGHSRSLSPSRCKQRPGPSTIEPNLISFSLTSTGYFPSVLKSPVILSVCRLIYRTERTGCFLSSYTIRECESGLSKSAAFFTLTWNLLLLTTAMIFPSSPKMSVETAIPDPILDSRTKFRPYSRRTEKSASGVEIISGPKSTTNSFLGTFRYPGGRLSCAQCLCFRESYAAGCKASSSVSYAISGVGSFAGTRSPAGLLDKSVVGRGSEKNTIAQTAKAVAQIINAQFRGLGRSKCRVSSWMRVYCAKQTAPAIAIGRDGQL